MLAVGFNIVIMIALIFEAQRHISINREEEFMLINTNITDLTCEQFCAFKIEVGDTCCKSLTEICVDKSVCF
jgi:hypothetical protein